MQLNLKPETKALLKEALFVHHLPFVETVIFIATPHGGSYQSSLTVVGLFTRLVTLPLTIASATADVLANAGDDAEATATFNSITGMSPGNPAIEAAAQDPGRARHPRLLDHSDAAGRPAGDPRRRRGGIQERPHRWGGLRGRDRTLWTLDPRQPTDRSRGPPNSDRGTHPGRAAGWEPHRGAPRRPRNAGRGANANPPPLRRARRGADSERERDRRCCGASGEADPWAAGPVDRLCSAGDRHPIDRHLVCDRRLVPLRAPANRCAAFWRGRYCFLPSVP